MITQEMWYDGKMGGNSVCRLCRVAIEPHFPMVAIKAFEVMKEGHNGSVVGLFMAHLDGELGSFKGLSIPSGIFTPAGIKRLGLTQRRQNINYAITRPYGIGELCENDPLG